MGSKFGFGDIAGKLGNSVVRPFLSGGIKLAQEEFKSNFKSESSAGNPWEDITYREVPPPILDLTGRMKSETISGIPSISVSGSSGKAVLNINPVDERGREYSQYHEQDSSGETGTKGEGEYGHNIQREFVTQGLELDIKQENLLLSLLDNIFK